MSTSQKLQKPKIINITGSSIRIAHPDISGNISTTLAAPALAAAESITVLDNDGFANADWMVVGSIGDNQTETTVGDAAVTRGSTIAVTNHLSFDHELDAKVTKINERGITIYGAATDGGAGTIIESIDAKTASGRQLADAQMVQWDRPYTEYTLQAATDTPYAYYYVKFTDGTTTSDASDYIAAAGLVYNSAENFINQALRITGSRITGVITREMCVEWANDCQSAISQFVYQDPTTGEYMQMDWDFEVTEDISSMVLTTYENEYALTGLDPDPKYINDRAIIGVRLGSEGNLQKQTIDAYDDETAAYTRSRLNGAAAANDVLLTLDSVYDFDASGTIYASGSSYAYTVKDGTNATLAMAYTDASPEVATTLSAPTAVADLTLTVTSIAGFSASDFIEVTDGTNTQVFQINGAPAGNTIALSQSVAFVFAATTTVTVVESTEITATIADNSVVWQSIQPGLPKRYTIYGGKIILNKPPSSEHTNRPLKIRYFKELTRLTEASDTTPVPFTNVFQYYIGSMIERRKGNAEKALELMQVFNNAVLSNALKNKAPTTDEYTYHYYEDYSPGGGKITNRNNNYTW